MNAEFDSRIKAANDTVPPNADQPRPPAAKAKPAE